MPNRKFQTLEALNWLNEDLFQVLVYLYEFLSMVYG